VTRLEGSLERIFWGAPCKHSWKERSGSSRECYANAQECPAVFGSRGIARCHASNNKPRAAGVNTSQTPEHTVKRGPRHLPMHMPIWCGVHSPADDAATRASPRARMRLVERICAGVSLTGRGVARRRGMSRGLDSNHDFTWIF